MKRIVNRSDPKPKANPRRTSLGFSYKSDSRWTTTIVYLAITTLITVLILGRVIPQFQAYASEIAFLKVAAKCPGLPYGADSGGPDYINIGIDLALGIVTVALVAITVRDWRRRRKISDSQSDLSSS